MSFICRFNKCGALFLPNDHRAAAIGTSSHQNFIGRNCPGGFQSLLTSGQKKKHILTDVLFWWARRDLNPHVRSEH